MEALLCFHVFVSGIMSLPHGAIGWSLMVAFPDYRPAHL